MDDGRTRDDSDGVSEVLRVAKSPKPTLEEAAALGELAAGTTTKAAGLSLPTIQRMEASDGNVRSNVDSVIKLIVALKAQAPS